MLQPSPPHADPTPFERAGTQNLIVGAATHFNGTSLISYFPILIFANGFVSGATGAWSAVLP